MDIQTYNKHIIDENYTLEVIDFGNKIHNELQEIGGINGINLENRKKIWINSLG